jgi:uncharacterized protein YjbJ (UPF0337 family)
MSLLAPGPIFDGSGSVRHRTDSPRGSSDNADMEFTTSHHHKENPMNWDRIEGNWKQVTGKAKVQWGKLTDDDLDVIAGRRDVMAGKIQERYGVAKDEMPF